MLVFAYMNVLKYFREGFRLTNKSLDLLIIAVTLTLFSYISGLTTNIPFAIFFTILNILVIFFSYGYMFSLPLFLVDKQGDKKTNFNKIFDISVRNTKLLIVPGIIFVILIFFLSFLFILWLALTFRGQSVQITRIFQSIGSQLSGWNVYVFLLTCLMSFLSYTSFFFALENKGVFTSIKASILYRIKHIHFTFAIIIINASLYTIISLSLLFPATNIWASMIRLIITGYSNFVITTSALLYYQKHKGELPLLKTQ